MGKANILLVEDSRSQAETTRSFLERSGYDVVVAEDGKIAIKEALLVAGDGDADGVKPGTEATILEGESYSLLVKKNNASERVDKTKISNALFKRGFTEGDVLKFMAEITTPTKPATSVRAVPRG